MVHFERKALRFLAINVWAADVFVSTAEALDRDIICKAAWWMVFSIVDYLRVMIWRLGGDGRTFATRFLFHVLSRIQV